MILFIRNRKFLNRYHKYQRHSPLEKFSLSIHAGQIDIAWKIYYSIINNRIIIRTKTVLDSVTDRFSRERHLTSITLSFILSRFYDLFVSPYLLPFSHPDPCTAVSLNFSSPVSKLCRWKWAAGRAGEKERGDAIYSQERTPRVHRYLAPRAVAQG